MRWHMIDDDFWVAQAGLLHAGMRKDGRTWNWWVGTVDARKDKADEYAAVQGIHTRREDAKRDVENAMETLVREMGNALGLMIE